MMHRMSGMQQPGTAEPSALQCPACGSTDLAPVHLSLIRARYYKCGNCIVTFRAAPREEERADINRFNQGWFVDDKPKS